MGLLKSFAAKAQAARGARERKRAPAVPLAPHAPMLAADPYSFAVSHRRMAWLLRLIAGYSVVVPLLCVVLGTAIATMLPLKTTNNGQIGRATCRARVCQYVSLSVVAVSLI